MQAKAMLDVNINGVPLKATTANASVVASHNAAGPPPHKNNIYWAQILVPLTAEEYASILAKAMQ